MRVPYQKRYAADLGADFLTTGEVRLSPADGVPEYATGFGMCPRCGHRVTVHERIHVLDFYGPGSHPYWQHCNCEEVHRGRPPGAQGCGAGWPVTITWTRPDGR